MNQLKDTWYWVFFLFLILCTTYTKTTPSILDSMVIITMEDSTGQSYFSSGFFVCLGEICTNHHVIKNKKSGYIRLINQETRYEITNTLAINEKQDLAILKISHNLNPYILPIGNSKDIKKYDRVTTIGNPGGIEGIITHGIVSKIINNVCFDSIRAIPFDRVIETTAKIFPGSSGGPVLNNKNEIIGISFASNEEQNYAIPSSHLKKLLIKIRRTL